MPSLDFDQEKSQFREFYDTNREILEAAQGSFKSLITALISSSADIAISKIEGRLKEREECIKKFNLKYRTELEKSDEEYAIRDHITDLIGLRIVCLYEDDIERVRACLEKHFDVIDVTDKIAQVEKTEGSFGYKGLHLDLRLNEDRKTLPEYQRYSELRFEVQIRTIIQDSWSVLDHKIKYKKMIPNSLRRRINTLAALFELADREFREIRDGTIKEIEKEEMTEDDLKKETDASEANTDGPKFTFVKLNAFSFLRIANHFFPGFAFESHKVDGFTAEIVGLKPGISRGKFNFYMRENIATVKRYKQSFEEKYPADELNPYTMIRHCLYLGEKEAFESILTNVAKERFENWLRTDGQQVGGTDT